MKVFETLSRLFGGKTTSPAPVSSPAVPEIIAPPADIYPPGFSNFVRRYGASSRYPDAPFSPGLILFALANGGGERYHMTFVNQALDMPEVQEYINNPWGTLDYDPGTMLQPILSHAVCAQDIQTVRRILDLGFSPQSPTQAPISDSLFISMVGFIPSTFKRDEGLWTSKEPTSEAAKEIFRMVFESARGGWGEDRLGFIKSLNGGKSISGDTVYVYGTARSDTRRYEAGILSAARPEILEVLKEIDPQIYQFKDRLDVLHHRLKTAAELHERQHRPEPAGI